MIVDLRLLNAHCSTPSFTQEDIRTVKEIVHYNDDIATVDLKVGFMHVPLSVECRYLFGFHLVGF